MSYIKIIISSEETEILISVAEKYLDSLKDDIEDILNHQDESDEYSDTYDAILDAIEEYNGQIIAPDVILRW